MITPLYDTNCRHRSTTPRAASTFTRSHPTSAVTGLISKHFIWTESGWAGGVYQWNRIEDAKVLHRAVAQGHHPALRHEATDRFLRVFAVTDNTCGRVELFKETAASK